LVIGARPHRHPFVGALAQCRLGVVTEEEKEKVISLFLTKIKDVRVKVAMFVK
jgi:hypothetical protein